MNIVRRFFGHLHTVGQHRRMVRRLCFKCGLYWQGLIHDLSKYSPTEFFNGVRFYTGTASPHLGERKAYGYSKAWLHHKGRNKHHAEYWNDILPNGKNGNIPMPMKYLGEMICDRIGASKIYLKNNYKDSSPWDYYYSHRDENQFNPQTEEQLQYYLRTLRDEGEVEMFRKLKEDIHGKV